MPVSSRSAPSKAAVARRIALGSAIRGARGEINQAELGARLTKSLGVRVTQATISRWELGLSELTLEQVRAVEVALKMPAGSLARDAGYF